MDTRVANNTRASRYELFVDDELAAIADDEPVGQVLVFPHTEVRADMRGRGLGEYPGPGRPRRRPASGRTVRATCWFVAEFLENTPEFADLAA